MSEHECTWLPELERPEHEFCPYCRNAENSSRLDHVQDQLSIEICNVVEVEHKNDLLSSRLDHFQGALERIASQKVRDEWPEDWHESLDFEGGFEGVVQDARRALASVVEGRGPDLHGTYSEAEGLKIPSEPAVVVERRSLMDAAKEQQCRSCGIMTGSGMHWCDDCTANGPESEPD